MMKLEAVEAMLHLRSFGWGLRRIAREFGCSKNTVKRYVATDGWMVYSRWAGGGKLEDQEAWLKDPRRHGAEAPEPRPFTTWPAARTASGRAVDRGAVAPQPRELPGLLVARQAASTTDAVSIPVRNGLR